MYNSALLRRWPWVRVPPNPLSIFRSPFPRAPRRSRLLSSASPSEVQLGSEIAARDPSQAAPQVEAPTAAEHLPVVRAVRTRADADYITSPAMPGNGALPVTISQSVTPSEYRSERISTWTPANCSSETASSACLTVSKSFVPSPQGTTNSPTASWDAVPCDGSLLD
jgi:hypothetical protein